MTSPVVDRFQASLFPVNAYLIDLPDGVVVVDATMGMTDGRALRNRVSATRKPLRGIAVTHTHPDHYGGLAALVQQGEDVPIFAVQGVRDAIRRDDPAKEQILRPMFADEWPHQRVFPNRVVRDGERLTFDDCVLRVVDLGPGESPHDSIWVLETGGPPQAFVGDLVYNRMHGYLADGFHEAWLANIVRARRELPADTTFYPGHGNAGAAGELLQWQEGYIRTLLDAVRSVSQDRALTDEAVTAAVTGRMKGYLASDDLLFLMQLSVAPLRAALTGGTAGGR